MKIEEQIDCIALKRSIQAKIQKEDEGLTFEQIEEKRARKLRDWDHPLARRWERFRVKQES